MNRAAITQQVLAEHREIGRRVAQRKLGSSSAVEQRAVNAPVAGSPDPQISRRRLFGFLGAATAAAASRIIPTAETVAARAPQLWETTWIAGRKFFWDGVRWVKTYSNEYLIK